MRFVAVIFWAKWRSGHWTAFVLYDAVISHLNASGSLSVRTRKNYPFTYLVAPSDISLFCSAAGKDRARNRCPAGPPGSTQACKCAPLSNLPFK